MLAKVKQAEAFTRPCVLLVDDEWAIRALLAEELRAQGLAVTEAASADEAWAYLEAGGKADMLFSDIVMPGSMNGVELARRVRKAWPHIKTVLTSGNPGPEDISSLGLFLQKPYKLERAAHAALAILGVDPF